MQQNNQAYQKTVKTKEKRIPAQAMPKGKQWKRHDKAKQWETIH